MICSEAGRYVSRWIKGERVTRVAKRIRQAVDHVHNCNCEDCAKSRRQLEFRPEEQLPATA